MSQAVKEEGEALVPDIAETAGGQVVKEDPGTQIRPLAIEPEYYPLVDPDMDAVMEGFEM